MSVELPIGGQWERLQQIAWDDTLSGGWTREFTADGSKFRMLRFDLGFVGQAVNINIHGTARMWGAINKNKHDGSGIYIHPQSVNNSRYSILGRGTGYLRGFMIPKRVSGPVASGGSLVRGFGWLMNFHGYSAEDGAGGWAAAGNDYWRIGGRIFIANNDPDEQSWNMQYGFSTNAHA